MSDDKQKPLEPCGQDDQTTNERKAALVKAICEEMGELTPEELERLYAAIALMELEKDE